MNYASILSLLVCAAYLLHTGVLPSISDSYRRVNKAIYHLFFGVLSVLVWAQSYYVSDALDFLYGGAGFFLFGVSIWASFWKGEEHSGHIVFTLGAIVLGMTGTVLRVGFLPVIVFAGCLIPLYWMKNRTFWVEVWAILTIFLPIL